MSKTVKCEKHECSYALPTEEFEKDNLIGECPRCMQEERDRLRERLSVSPKTAALGAQIEDLREWLSRMQPSSRELSLALTKLDECEMWARAGIWKNCKEER